MAKKEYRIGEVFRHTDGQLYRCVGGETCEGCAFTFCDSDCRNLRCGAIRRKDGNYVKFIEVTKPVEGMLYRAENGRMYRLAEGSHYDHLCACDTDPSRSCGSLDKAIFGGALLDWYWAPVEEDAPVEPPKRHIELAVVKVEGDEVTFRVAEQTHRCDEFSQQANTDEFKACNGIGLMSYSVPQWLSSASALYCRGEDKEQDNNRLTCTAGEFSRISEAISEYNSTDGKGCEPRWPKEGDRYFYVTTFGTTGDRVFGGFEFDRKMQAFGNFFRTEAEAEAALERVRQAMKG